MKEEEKKEQTIRIERYLYLPIQRRAFRVGKTGDLDWKTSNRGFLVIRGKMVVIKYRATGRMVGNEHEYEFRSAKFGKI